MASYSEDFSTEFSSAPIIYRHCLGVNFSPHSLNAGTIDFGKVYNYLVTTYSERSFKHEEDIFHGFIGILQKITNIYNEPFLWHLPLSFFTGALQWGFFGIQKRRRLDLHLFEQSDGTIEKHRLPSWSWIGWVGKASIRGLSRDLELHTAVLSLYTVDTKGNFQPIQGPKSPSIRHRPTHRLWKGTEKTPLAENIPQHLLSSAEARIALCFWSSLAELSVYQGVASFESSECVYETNTNLKFYIAWEQVPSNLSNTKNTYTAIVIGATGIMYENNEWLKVMLVSFDRGIAFREGMLNMWEEDWLKLDRTWKQITLC